MANTPIPPSSALVSVKILIDGQEIDSAYEVTLVQVDREVNKIARAKVCIADGNPNTQLFEASESGDFVPGKEIEIQAGYDASTDTIFKGIIGKHRIRSLPGMVSELQLFCSDKATKLTLGRNNRNYEQETDGNAISKIIKEKGLQASVQSTAATYPNVLQYYSTDWDFILSRAEVNGMIVTTRDGKVEVGPPDVGGSPILKVEYGLDVYSFDLELDAEDQMVSVRSKAWDSKQLQIIEENSAEPAVNQQGNINGKKLAEVLNVSNFELQATTPVDKGVLKTWANAQLLKARLSRIKGTLEFPGNASPYPNTLIELEGFGPRFNGNAYISRVSHLIREGAWVTEVGCGLSSQWFIAETPNVNASPASGLLPGIEGLQIGTVKKIDGDPDNALRILVDIPIIEPSGKGVWARLSQLYATNKAGTFFLPEVGDEVILGFLNNDPRYPVILGMMYSQSKKTAPFQAEAKNETKAIVTREQLKITFDEKNKDIIIETPKGNKVTLSDKEDALKLVDSNGNKVTMDKSGIMIDSSKDVQIKAKGQISLAANTKIVIDAKADVAVSGLNIKNAAKVAFSAEGNAQAELKAAGQTSVKGAMVMIN